MPVVGVGVIVQLWVRIGEPPVQPAGEDVRMERDWVLFEQALQS